MSDDEPSPRIPDPGFADDDGAADERLAHVLAEYDAGRAPYVEVLDALRSARLLVPVVSVLGDVEIDEAGLAHDKTSDMAAVLTTRPDGRRGLLAFTGVEAMSRWDPRARPVPVAIRLAAQAAVQEQADALVIDLAGPRRFAVEGKDLQAIAAGWQLTRVGEQSGWIRPGGE